MVRTWFSDLLASGARDQIQDMDPIWPGLPAHKAARQHAHPDTGSRGVVFAQTATHGGDATSNRHLLDFEGSRCLPGWFGALFLEKDLTTLQNCRIGPEKSATTRFSLLFGQCPNELRFVSMGLPYRGVTYDARCMS